MEVLKYKQLLNSHRMDNRVTSKCLSWTWGDRRSLRVWYNLKYQYTQIKEILGISRNGREYK